MTQEKSGNPDLKMKVSVVAEDTTMRKIMRKYLKEIGLEETIPPNNGKIMPLAIFWLKK
jgi:hypothetical protein